MTNRKMAFALATVAAAAFPLVAGAQQTSQQHVEAPAHFAATEAGIKEHPEQAGPGKSEAEVAAELRAAQANPEWAGVLRWGAPIPVKNAGQPKTRAQVMAELERAQSQPGWERATRLGAPVVLPAVAPAR
ncbi:DUF4148 domain-containing protein [Acidovorax cavernicola]|uniref:DUF4148 domain-containing protein n=1 Tax=Acidovorax cavernicola TaxID=1675792 RepID=A0A9X8GW65_9BURK|nr:DUF4148 domain-containing protein [Acidovorax cavernicola]RIX82828.1 DUF4148 domain-containing protein [Acidovorax cavernicola]